MRRWTVWTIFGICVVISFVIMGWLSATTLKLDARGRERELEENTVRTAMQTMETSLLVLLVQENQRLSYTHGDTLASALFAKGPPEGCPLPTSVSEVPPYVRLVFEVNPEGHLTSPQIVEGGPNEAAHLAERDKLQSLVEPGAWDDLCPPTAANALVEAWKDNVPSISPNASPSRIPRLRWRQTPFQQELMGNAVLTGEDIDQDQLKAAWVQDELLLARRQAIGGLEYFQGCLLDWPSIERKLLSDIAALLPDAALEPVPPEDDAEPGGYRLVGLPVRLIPGPIPLGNAPMGMTAIQRTVVLGWTSLIIAAGAIAVVLRGVMALSERRGAFVSAVTHELRTPLTTFRMYTEMLEEDMIGKDKRRHYLGRLRTEAERLGHLVENVLSYARLEQGRRPRQMQAIRLSSILDHVRDRLTQRTEQAGMGIVFDANGAADREVRTDLAATEQVLFNLVDNACKYAATASDKRIHVEAFASNGRTALRVRNHGPGISKDVERRLFTPFSKSEIDAANSAPGVGLGLSLCRRLARDLGGDLVHEPSADGAAFVLRLPGG